MTEAQWRSYSTPQRNSTSLSGCSTPEIRRAAFTLVEVLIVVTIIAILAAAVIPLIAGDSRTTAAESALRINLSKIRLRLQHYSYDHNGRFPAEVSDGSFAAKTEDALNRQLTMNTSKSGKVVPTGTANAKGPYLMSNIPPCPVGTLSGSRSVSIVDEPGDLSPDGAPIHAWKYNIRTGKFICNTNDLSKSGTPYWQW